MRKPVNIAQPIKVMTLERKKWPRMKDGSVLVPALGHRFGERMRCNGCKLTFADHQNDPQFCKNPPKGEA